MWFPDERRLLKIKTDIKRVKELKMDPVRTAGWLTDFLIKIQLERLREEHPDRSCKEITEILRRILSERDRNEIRELR
jgi:hypothetical protein